MSATEVLERPVNAEESRTKRLKAATHSTHERLDQRIMRADPFADRQRYGCFLVMQYRFHRDLDALFSNPELDALLPDLAGRNRLGLIAQDLTDLGLELPQTTEPPVFAADQPVDMAEALGWLYVIEGSNLGAAFLLKYAAKLGLDETFGARHLAGSPNGRGLHWRTFTSALDGISLSPEAEERVIAGAESAFRRVHGMTEECFA